MPKTLSPIRPRPALKRCRYCKARFTPRSSGGQEQEFCTPQHRKNYHRYGTLPFDKLLARLTKEIKHLVPELVRAEMARQHTPPGHGD